MGKWKQRTRKIVGQPEVGIQMDGLLPVERLLDLFKVLSGLFGWKDFQKSLANQARQPGDTSKSGEVGAICR